MIKIDKGVPVPETRAKGGRKPIYPWEEMQPGDSFFVPAAKKMHINFIYSKKCMPGSRWASRTVTENGIRGIRVWRLT